MEGRGGGASGSTLAIRLPVEVCGGVSTGAAGSGHNPAWGIWMLTSGELVWLLAAVARGDEEAFEKLYAATRAKIYGVVLRILRRADLAEEVTQEAYVRVWRRARDFDPARASPITWMVAIARNRALDIVRKKTDAPIEEQPLSMDGSETPEPLVRREMTDDLRRLLACMGNLDEERRRLLLLAYYSGWTREQLAAKFD
jgi:RNA polymerase sigma-70 factor (ECF subfamily)